MYRVAGTPQTWHQALMAACLWGGDAAVASHRSAAALWALDGFPEGPLEITTRKQKCFPGRFRVHRAFMDPAWTTRKAGIPVTNAFRTLQDVVAVVDGRRANQTLDEALRKGLVSMDSLRRFVDREKKSGRRGVGVLRKLVEQREPGYQPSVSELQASVRRLLVGAGLEVVEEYVITDEGGNFIARADFRIFGAWVVVEVEGRANHSSKLDWQHDLNRRNRITAAGWAVIHATAETVHRPEEFLAEVHRAQVRQSRLRAGAP
ncbi:MAG TPA: hypothetical protein VGK51_14130 [Actinomycetota bacterium]